MYTAGSSISVGDQRHELKQFHFHHPREEKIGGKTFDMAIHLVHANSNGNLAVVAILLKVGTANSAIQMLWEHLPKEKKVEDAPVNVLADANGFLPSSLSYFTFDGSLTTPPCSEDVRRFVRKSPVTISAAQLDTFTKIYPLNARPTQPRGGRIIRESR